ncbi:MAG: hypothetical protein ACXAB8_19840 [Promethearchaeota archaeon]|jgi:hypothetical protein
MVQIVNNNLFTDISQKELMEATYHASGNFQVRAFFEAKEEILKTEKYSEEEFYEILDTMIDAETERKIVLEKLKGLEPLFLEEIAKIIKEFSPVNVIRDVVYLKEQGYVDEQIEIKTKMIKKKIKGEEKEVEVKEYFYRKPRIYCQILSNIILNPFLLSLNPKYAVNVVGARQFVQ